jgi:hypothetical protein
VLEKLFGPRLVIGLYLSYMNPLYALKNEPKEIINIPTTHIAINNSKHMWQSAFGFKCNQVTERTL